VKSKQDISSLLRSKYQARGNYGLEKKEKKEKKREFFKQLLLLRFEKK
jgi:hypothetical protein